ncbi:MAG: GNAT family protein [Gammaproteobacteria bacterium]|nr:GNAT family protein [Gammaproteobacteria bacterium]
MGSINLTLEPDHEQAELGFWFGVAYWRRGYTTESARAMLAYAFEELALNRVHAHHMLRNPASGAVLRKIGMQSEGVLRQRMKKSGTFEDVAIYAMLHREFASSQGVGVEEKVR